MAEIEVALLKTLVHEGVSFDEQNRPIPGRTGYVNHPDDPGGETNFGVTIGAARAAGWSGPMRDMPYAFAVKVYRERYWNRIQGDSIADQEIAEELFDTAVNCGPLVAIRFLQRTLNVLNAKGTRYADVVVDGDFGMKTLSALSAALALAPWYRTVILRALDSLQAVRYITLAEGNERLEAFVPGWLRTRVGRA